MAKAREGVYRSAVGEVVGVGLDVGIVEGGGGRGAGLELADNVANEMMTRVLGALAAPVPVEDSIKGDRAADAI
jgi:hypothetical protein